MLIGEASRITGLSRDTIRFYEKKGLIQVGRTESEWNNYKEFDASTIHRLKLIQKCKGFGFTLREIGEMLDLFDNQEASCQKVSNLVNHKIEEIEAKICKLQEMKAILIQEVSRTGKVCHSKEAPAENCNTLKNYASYVK